jgi:formate hydrogenlyase subunit 3/multisubunit Na+/H+ antiporter MnhD subunit
MTAMADSLIEIVGWVGAILVLLAYFLITARKLDAKTKIYHAMNLAGGTGLAVNAIADSAYPSAAVNLVWIAVACYGILKGTVC